MSEVSLVPPVSRCSAKKAAPWAFPGSSSRSDQVQRHHFRNGIANISARPSLT